MAQFQKEKEMKTFGGVIKMLLESERGPAPKLLLAENKIQDFHLPMGVP